MVIQFLVQTSAAAGPTVEFTTQEAPREATELASAYHGRPIHVEFPPPEMSHEHSAIELLPPLRFEFRLGDAGRATGPSANTIADALNLLSDDTIFRDSKTRFVADEAAPSHWQVRPDRVDGSTYVSPLDTVVVEVPPGTRVSWKMVVAGIAANLPDTRIRVSHTPLEATAHSGTLTLREWLTEVSGDDYVWSFTPRYDGGEPKGVGPAGMYYFPFRATVTWYAMMTPMGTVVHRAQTDAAESEANTSQPIPFAPL